MVSSPRHRRPTKRSLISTYPINRFSWLPVVEDEEEAPHVYGYLCDLIQSNNPIILGANNANLPRIVTVIAEAFAHDVIPANHDVGRRMVEIVKQIEANPDVFQAVLGVLSEEQKQALEYAYGWH